MKIALNNIAAGEVREAWADRREYPRIKASCPVRYQISSEGEWLNAMLIDYSATGVRMQCDELILKGTKIKIEVLPGKKKNVPHFSAEGTVVRFSLDDEHQFHIGCEFNKAVRLLINHTGA